MAEEESESTKEQESDKDIIEDCREYLAQCVSAESDIRQDMLDDLHFCTLDQWPDDIRAERENDKENGPRPCLTIDKVNQYIVQIVNDARQGKPGINVRPMDDAADPATAKILKGIIRNIEDQSKADIAYATGVENSVKMGLGFWRVTTEYVDDESFDQEIFIRSIPNSFSVYLGPHLMPDGSDCDHGYVIETMPVDRFKEEYPGKKYKVDDFDSLQDTMGYWRREELITVVEEYKIVKTAHTLYFLADGTTISKSDYDAWPAEAGAKPSIQDTRTSFKKQLKWAKMTGVQILDKRDLPGQYIPIVEVIGRESHVNGERILWGIVRPAKDSLRMYNYFASTITEKMGLAPKAPWLAAEGQLEGLEEKWKKANRVNYSFLTYKNVSDVSGNQVPAPARIGPPPMEAALLHQMQVIEHDVQTSLGMFKAAVGETESQQSGRAILALQKESDTGTYHFSANLGNSIRHTGVIIVDLIPHYYDTKRVVRILGEDGEVQTVQLDPNQPQAHQQYAQPGGGIQSIYNPGIGKYDVAITVGPSYNTKRMEAAATLTEVIKAQPQLMPMIGDLLFRSLDFPYSDQIAQRLKKMLPPQLQEGGPSPEQKLMMLTQKMQQMGEQMQEMQQENVQLKAGAQEGMAKVQVQAKEAEAKLQVQQQETAAELALQKQKQDGELQLAREKAAAEIEIKRAVAEADHGIEIGKLKLQAQKQEQEKVDKAKADSAAEAEDIAPKLLEGLAALVQELKDARREEAQHRAKPRQITAVGANGMKMSATVQ